MQPITKTNLDRLLEAEQRIATLEHSYGVLLASNNELHKRVAGLIEGYNLLMQAQIAKTPSPVKD